MVFDKDGGVSGFGETAVNLGNGWNVSTSSDTAVNTIDIFVDTNSGMGYCFVNGALASYTKNLQTDGTWHGYLIYTSGSWSEGDTFKWQYDNDLGESGKGSSYTKYVDTESHTVTIDEALDHKGLSLPFFSDANYSVGGGDIKGAIKTGTVWTRTHGGSSDAVRTTCTMEVNPGQSAGDGTQILQAYTNVNASGCKLVHARFRVNCTSGWGIRIRQADNTNTQWMTFSKDGGVYGVGKTAVNLGTWNVSTDSDVVNTIDMVVNPNTGVGYCFVNGNLASCTQNLQTDGTWHGYLIYTSGSWSEGDNLKWQYDNNLGESGKGSSYTKYVDTTGYTVDLTDVLGDKGLTMEINGSVTMAAGAVLDAEDFVVDLRDVHINAENGYVKVGDALISGSDIYLNNSGKLRMGDGKSAKVSVENEDGTTSQGFLFGKTAPTGTINVTFKFVNNGATPTAYDDKEFTWPFDFTGSEISGNANYGLSVAHIPSPLELTLVTE